MRASIILVLFLAAAVSVSPAIATAQDSRVSNMGQYSESSASTGYFRQSETLPGSYQLYLQGHEVKGGFWGIGPGGGAVKRQSFSADAHAGVRNYRPNRDCASCHTQSVKNIHTARTTVTCRQCHRGQPIAGIHHYYSPLNPIRRHAYVCAKCHQGATANFATYLVHEPNPLAVATAQKFPALFYGVWIMAIIAGGVFIVFIPYVTLWGIRDAAVISAKKLIQKARDMGQKIDEEAPS